jgi:hypothetical protein
MSIQLNEVDSTMTKKPATRTKMDILAEQDNEPAPVSKTGLPVHLMGKNPRFALEVNYISACCCVNCSHYRFPTYPKESVCERYSTEDFDVGVGMTMICDFFVERIEEPKKRKRK